MTEEKSYPLNGVKTSALLGELVREYGWDILAKQIPYRCFTSYPSFESSLKFLMKTEWARQRVEAFYLYKFKQLPRPDDEQHQLPPRNRLFEGNLPELAPAKIDLSDPEFFDDPISGPVSRPNTQSRKRAKSSPSKVVRRETDVEKSAVQKSPKGDSDRQAAPNPWAKWS